MTLVLIDVTLRALAFVVLYVFIGFGPGLIVGMLLANRFVGRGKPTFMERHQRDKRLAAEHNAQWHPKHERWQRS